VNHVDIGLDTVLPWPWSLWPRGASRTTLVMSLALALALGAKSLALALASENMYLALALEAKVLALALALGVVALTPSLQVKHVHKYNTV